MFTAGQIAEMLEISLSTLRRYNQIFKDYLSETARRKRGRRYTTEDAAILGQVKQLFGAGYSQDEVKAQLNMVESGQSSRDLSQITSLVPDIAGPLQEAIDGSRSNRARLDNVETELERQRANSRAWSAYLRLPWWKRMFTRPPE